MTVRDCNMGDTSGQGSAACMTCLDISFVGQQDGRLLSAATQESLTLVTYDLRTIPTVLSELFADAEAHSAVIFVDDASIRSNNFGRLERALAALWQRYPEEDWTNRVAFLEPV